MNNHLDDTQFVEELSLSVLAHRAVNHPYLEALSEGTVPDLFLALRSFALHYSGYSLHFPRYLTALISRLEDPAHRAVLLQNLTEENGNYEPAELRELVKVGIDPDWIEGIPHPELFQRFCRALGVEKRPHHEDHLEVQCWREMFFSLLVNSSAAEAVGALGLGTETIVQASYRPIEDAINRFGAIEPRDAVFFPLHTTVDDHHQEALKEIAVSYASTLQGRIDLEKGAMKALSLRDSFWNWLHQRTREGTLLGN